MIYSGGFLADADRRTLDRLRRLAPVELAKGGFRFADPRLPELLMRYRARNWPETLNPDECEQWDAWRFGRLTDPDGGGSIHLDKYEEQLAALAQTHAADPAKLRIIEELAAWSETLMDAGD
jgi:exodeoxyribonuclease-1